MILLKLKRLVSLFHTGMQIICEQNFFIQWRKIIFLNDITLFLPDMWLEYGEQKDAVSVLQKM